jgi:hypothetical protein
MCASKIGRTLGVGDGVGEGEAVGLGEGDAATVAVEVGVGKTAAGCPHAASNTNATSNPRAITL